MYVKQTRASGPGGYTHWLICNLERIISGGKGISKLLVVFWVLLSLSLLAQAPPTTPTPASGSTDVFLNVALSWNASINATGNPLLDRYQIEVNDDPTFTNATEYAWVGNTLVANPCVGLVNNTLYSWRVKVSTNGGGAWGAWGPAWTFRTIPAASAPALGLPIDNATNIAANVSLTWGASAGADRYKLEVFTDALLTTPAAFSPIITVNQFSGPLVLGYTTDYWWRVSASNDGGANYGTASAARKFTTTAFPAASMSYPINTLTGVTLLPNFQWTWGGAGVATYDLVVTQTTPAGPTVTKAGLTGTSYQWTEADGILLNNTVYTYTVTVHQDLLTEVTTGTFTTIPTVEPYLSNPPNNRTAFGYQNATFNWYNIGTLGSNHYRLQVIPKAVAPVAADWYIAGVPVNTYSGTNKNFTMPLVPNTKYYWRVQVLNAAGGLVCVSPVWNVTTSGGAVTPYLSFPINGAKVLTNAPTLYWYTGGVDLNNVVFDLDITDGVADTRHITGISEIKYEISALTPLIPGRTYTWFVTARPLAGGGASITSAPSTFVTAGEGTAYQAVLSFPVNGTTVYSIQPTLYWYIGKLASGVIYSVDVYTVSGGGGWVWSIVGLLDAFSTTVPVPLTPGMTYYWRVRTIGAVPPELVSAEQSFVVSNSLGAGTPVASFPLYEADIIYSNLPTLYWWMNGITTGLHHFRVAWTDVQPANDAAWDAVATHSADIVNLAATSYALTSPADVPLQFGHHYYWAVSAWDAGGTRKGSWSTGEFTIFGGAGVGVPTLNYPIQGATVISLRPELSWWFNGSTGGIQRYEIQYSRTSTFSGTDTTGAPYSRTILTPNAVDLTYTITADLTPGATYYWRVRAFYGGTNYGGYSTTETFVVNPGSSLIVPLAGSPAQGVGITSGSATLSWVIPSKPGGDMKFEVQHSTNASMTDAKTVSDITTANVNVSGLESGKTYYWRVRSTNSKGEHSDYSEVAKFSVSSVTAVENTITEMPVSFSLEQNYPNPFNPVTEIRFGLMKDGFTTLKIYNVLGQEIRTLLSETKQAGTYRMQWDGKDNNGSTVQSGTYVYRLVNGNDVSAKKMIMLK